MAQHDPEERIADLERQLAETRAGRGEERRDARADRRRERREEQQQLRDEMGISAARRRIERVVMWALLSGAALGIVVFIAGLTAGGRLLSIGLALFAGSVIPMLAMVRARGRKLANLRWTEGIVTFRSVEPGDVDEYGQRVVCEVQAGSTARVLRVAAKVGPLDTQRLVAGATMRCLLDPTDQPRGMVLRVFPYAAPGAPLPAGRELKFSGTTASA
jgi:hypothetical protein